MIGYWKIQGLNSDLYHTDCLHLNEAGNIKFAISINNILEGIRGGENGGGRPKLTHHPNLSLDDGYAIGQSECLGRGWDGPSTSTPPKPPCSVQCSSSVYVSPSSLLCDDFPPLPPPLLAVSRLRPCLPTRTITRSNVPRNTNVSKPVRSCDVSNHTSKCDYVFVPPSPVSRSVSRPVPRRVPHHVRNVNVSKPVSKPICSNSVSDHTLPLRKLNKVKPAKGGFPAGGNFRYSGKCSRAFKSDWLVNLLNQSNFKARENFLL